MAGTVTSSSTDYPDKGRKPASSVTLAWLSDGSGNVSGTLSQGVNGTLCRVTFAPDAGGTQPSDAYDATLLDQSGVDVLAGRGGNLSNATTTTVCPALSCTDGTTSAVAPFVLDGTLELRIANAGAGKGGTVTLYLR